MTHAWHKLKNFVQEFDGQAAYAPFHEAAFKQRLTLATPHELDLMQQMLDWREGEIHNEIRLLDAAEDDCQGRCQPVKLCCLPWEPWFLNVVSSLSFLLMTCNTFVMISGVISQKNASSAKAKSDLLLVPCRLCRQPAGST